MADNEALGELAAQDRYDPIVPAPDVLPRSTQVLGGLADLGGVDPVVLPQNPNPLADNPFSHYVAQKLFGLGQNAVSALSVPGEVWKGNLDPTSDEGMDRAIGLAQMITEAPRGGGAGPGTVLGSGIRAYHGSPYDFDRFDMNQIGTGEGAQAYGHGLYFAENPEVAASYKKPPVGSDYAQVAAKNALDRFSGDNPQAIAYLEDLAKKSTDLGGDARGYYGAARLLRAGAVPPSRMYEVNINAHPDEFLDWDKPASQSAASQVVSPIVDKLRSSSGMIDRRLGSDPSGEQIYSSIGTPFGRKALTGNSEGFSNKALSTDVLRDAGIPGIKYLDQGSRGSGAGTSNYVVFNDKLIDILRKYGLAGLTAGAGATAAGQQMDNSAPFGMIGAVPVAGGAMGSLARQDQYQ